MYRLWSPWPPGKLSPLPPPRQPSGPSWEPPGPPWWDTPARLPCCPAAPWRLCSARGQSWSGPAKSCRCPSQQEVHQVHWTFPSREAAWAVLSTEFCFIKEKCSGCSKHTSYYDIGVFSYFSRSLLHLLIDKVNGLYQSYWIIMVK